MQFRCVLCPSSRVTHYISVIRLSALYALLDDLENPFFYSLMVYESFIGTFATYSSNSLIMDSRDRLHRSNNTSVGSFFVIKCSASGRRTISDPGLQKWSSIHIIHFPHWRIACCCFRRGISLDYLTLLKNLIDRTYFVLTCLVLLNFFFKEVGDNKLDLICT